MLQRHVSVLGSCFLAIAVCADGQTRPAQAEASPDPSVANISLVTQCSVSRTRPRDQTEWERLVARLGFHRKANDSAWWLTTPTGKLRAEAFFRPEESSYWILYFPASSERVSDAILSHWLKDSQTSLDAGDLEIVIAPAQSLTGGGSKVQSVTVAIAGGRLLASRTTIEWKER